MAASIEKLAGPLARLDAQLASAVSGAASPATRAAAEKWRADGAALRFHLERRGNEAAPLVAVIGGTGTGKSTLVNRLLDLNVSAASFRRTFPAGAVAVARRAADVPDRWLGIDHVRANDAELPVRGQIGSLLVVEVPQSPFPAVLVDTPDLDGDTPSHHVQADRGFRWADVALFLGTPEKYQMTELLPYYRLARRYGVPALHVMNKCEEAAVLDDYCGLLANRATDGDRTAHPAMVFAVARDDAGYEPPKEANLDA